MSPEQGQTESNLHQNPLEPTQTMPAGETGSTVVGRYHLLQRIGEGGMGEVWLAEQKEPVRRRVAVKLIKAGMGTRDVIARFESERQALALMEHDAIAKVLDAGATPEGVPYFVMEYIAGIPITAYCDEHRLTTRDRLRLFTRVCEGVQHAHQKAIIHRDLKPSNILVTEADGRAAPKIIDFGLAKALAHRLTDITVFTRVGAMVGTPSYMSPEQARSSGEDIDTRTDVYSLGIILYELLAGAPPIEFGNAGFEEFLRRLREDDPPKPSTRIRSQDATASSEVSRRRQTEPRILVSQLRGDLDSITLKALEKDRARRYGSAEQLSADITRYLEGRPVMARPATLQYRAAKYIQRHRWGVAGVCAIVASLAGGLVAEQRQARLAAERFDLVRDIAHKLIFDIQNEVARLPGSTKPREMLVGAAVDYLDRLSRTAGDDPNLLAELAQGYVQVGRAQGFPSEPNLGRPKDAVASMQKAIALNERAARLDAGRRFELSDVYLRMGTLSHLTGDVPSANEYSQKGVALAETLNRESPGSKRVLTLLAIANAIWGDRLAADDGAKALAAYEKCKIYQSELVNLDPTPENRIRLVRANSRVGTAASSLSLFDVARKALGDAETGMQQLLGEEPKNPAFQRQMALTYQSLSFLNENPEFPSLGNTPMAIEYARKYVAAQQAQVDADPNDANGEFGLAMALLCQSQAQRKASVRDSLESARRALELMEKNVARSPGSTLAVSRRARVLIQLGRARLAAGDQKGALEVSLRGLEEERKVAASASQDPDEQRVLLWALLAAAEVMDAAGDRERADRVAAEAGVLAERLSGRTPLQLMVVIPATQAFCMNAARQRDGTSARAWLERNARLWRDATPDTEWVRQRRVEAEARLQGKAGSR